MNKLKLTKGRSYNGFGVKVRAEKPIVEAKDKKTADALMATGRFIVAPAEESKNT